MSRKRALTNTWQLDGSTPQAVANATICLALLRCVRRLPGCYPRHSSDELAMHLAPVLEPHMDAVVAALLANQPTSVDDKGWIDVELAGSDVLHNAEVLELLGERLAQGDRRFSALFDQVEAHLEAHVAAHTAPYHQNVRFVSELLALPPAAKSFLTLAGAFCHGSIDRTIFTFVDTAAELQRVLPSLCGAVGTRMPRLFDADSPLVAAGLLPSPRSDRRAPDLDDLLALTAAGDRLMTEPFQSPQEMAGVVLDRMAPCQAAAPLVWPHLGREKVLLHTVLRESLANGQRGVNILVHGAPGSGKTEFVRQLLCELGAEAFSVRCTDARGREADREERLESLRLGQAVCAGTPRAVLVLDEAEDVFTGNYNHPLARLFAKSDGSKAWMNALMEGNAHPVVWISNAVAHLDPAYLRRFSFCLEFPRTPLTQRLELAEQAFAGTRCSADAVRGIAQHDDVTPGLLTAAARFTQLASSSGVDADTAALTYLRQHFRASGREDVPALRPVPRPMFDTQFLNLSGSATAEQVLAALARGTEATMLLSGPPGTGKTQFAREVAARLGRRLVVRTASDLNSKWYGESERNVAAMFRECDTRAEVLFLDEADVLLGARSTAVQRADRAVTAEFLRWLETFQGTFLCATNHPETYDPALGRRFMFRLHFQPLDEAQRLALFARMTGHSVTSDQARVLSSLHQLTPGDFANVSKRVQALGLERDVWLRELAEEHAAKATAHRRIGF